MRALVPAVMAVVALAVTSCTGDTDDPADEVGESADPSADGTENEQVPTARHPVIERVPAGEGSALVAGPGEERYQVAGAASNGTTIVAVGSLIGEDLADHRPAWLSSSDGRTWESGGEGLDEATWLKSVVAVDDELVAVGNADGDEEPMVWPYANGTFGQPEAVTFPDRAGSPIVESAVVVGSRLYVLGLMLDAPAEPGQIDPDDPPSVSVVVTASDDHGETWTPVEMPSELAPVTSNNALLETLAGGGVGVTTTLIGHGGGLLLTLQVPGVDGTEVWRLGEDGTWTGLGNTDELFDGERLDELHSHGDQLLAFTSADGDSSGWTSDDDGASFSRLDIPAAVLGGGGSQFVDAATSLADGTLVLAGRSAGEWNGLQTSTEAELWTTHDLKTWDRALADPGLASNGEVWPQALLAHGDNVMLLGTHERLATTEEVDAHNEEAQEGQVPPRHPLAQDAAAWVVSFDERPIIEPPADVAELEVTGFRGDVTISDVISYDGRLIASGWITEEGDEEGDDGETQTAALWASSDGESWERTDAPEVSEPSGQRVQELIATGDSLVAVGWTSDGESNYLGAWTSPDGVEWTRVDMIEPDFEWSVASAVAETDAGLVAVGTSDSGDEDRYRSVGIWLSTDGGETWTAVDTTGEPFRQQNVEVLVDVAVTPDGGIVAVGHTGDAEDRDGEGYSYTPEAYAVESADGETWTAVDSPFPDADWSDLQSIAVTGEGVVTVGRSGTPAAELPGEPTVSGSGVALRTGDGWPAVEGSYRHTAWGTEMVEAPFGSVLVGGWSRRSAGEDVLLGVLGEEGVTFVDDGLVSPGDQEALAAAVFDDRIVVLGTETVDDETTVVGWSVTG